MCDAGREKMRGLGRGGSGSATRSVSAPSVSRGKDGAPVLRSRSPGFTYSSAISTSAQPTGQRVTSGTAAPESLRGRVQDPTGRNPYRLDGLLNRREPLWDPASVSAVRTPVTKHYAGPTV